MLDWILWKYDYTDDKNERHYKLKTLMLIASDTTFHEVVVSSDKSKVVIIYFWIKWLLHKEVCYIRVYWGGKTTRNGLYYST